MTYNEWRDELKNNLLTVTEAERRRVLDYYAEAYADRREAGFSEREIIEGFGAPYDAAQRILNESADEREVIYEQDDRHHKRKEEHFAKQSNREDLTWVFVLLCVIFAIPIFIVVMTMVGVTLGLCVAPFGVVISGLGTVIGGISAMFSDLPAGIFKFGAGLITTGVGIMLVPLCIVLAKWMWKLFKMFFAWLKRLFSGKEKA